MTKMNRLMIAAMLTAVIALAAVARVHAVVKPGNGPAPIPTKCWTRGGC